MGNNPAKFQKGDNYPVENVYLDETKKFAKKLSALNNGAYQFRLPTEAEWEYACRSGGKQEKYAGGAEVDKFTMTKTKAELFEEGAINRGILIAPLYNTKDISEDIQLQSRGYWVKIEHPELNESLTYCGPFLQLTETPIEYRRRAPLVGEHNEEIYGQELGLSTEKLASLKKEGVI